MDLDKLVINKLVSRGFTKEQLLNNRGIIGATIDEVKELLSKNITYEPLLTPVFDKEDLANIYHIGFNHGKHVAPFQKKEIVDAFCKAFELNKKITWE